MVIRHSSELVARLRFSISQAAVPAPALNCPRCGKHLIRNYDEFWCVAHGEIAIVPVIPQTGR